MTSDLFDHLVKIHDHEKTDFRWSNLRKLIVKHVDGTRILDAGCGTGHITLELLKRGYDVTAIDNSEDMISFTQSLIKKNNFSSDVFQLDLTACDVFGENTFDTILCLDVLEHISDDRSAIKNLNYILTEGGTLIVSVPAIKYLYGKRDIKIGHYRRYDRKELIDKLKEFGFEVIDIRYWNFLGVLPFSISEKVLHRELYEGVRYSDRSFVSKILNKLLNCWFAVVENNVRFPVGLSFIVICKKSTSKAHSGCEATSLI